jgi:hypothetical protein
MNALGTKALLIQQKKDAYQSEQSCLNKNRIDSK